MTIRSVLNNLMLYQEGWGVESIKHSLTYSGGLSRGYARTYAPAAACGFDGFSPYTLPNVIEVAEAIPFIELTDWRPRTAVRPQGRDRAAAASRRSPDRHAGLPQAPLPARGARREAFAALFPAQRIRLSPGLPCRLRFLTRPARTSAAGSRRCGRRRTPSIRRRPHAFFVEPERTADGAVEDIATLFLDQPRVSVPLPDVRPVEEHHRPPRADGAIAAQIEYALARLPPARTSSSTTPATSSTPRPSRRRLPRHRRVVDSVSDRHRRVSSAAGRDALPGVPRWLRPALQVAMGLETVHPDVLPRLNKRHDAGRLRAGGTLPRAARHRRAGVYPAAAAVPRRGRGR